MESNAELQRLEEFVDKLLNRYNQLKADHHNLQNTLQERDNEVVELKNNINGLSSERTEVGSRVAGLIGRIEQWEDDHGQEGDADHEDEGGVQGELFEDEAEQQ